jgi:hypothetical protein
MIRVGNTGHAVGALSLEHRAHDRHTIGDRQLAKVALMFRLRARIEVVELRCPLRERRRAQRPQARRSVAVIHLGAFSIPGAPFTKRGDLFRDPRATEGGW